MLTLNVETHEVDLDGREIYLSPKEFETCKLIGSKPGFVFSREKVMAAVWGIDPAVGVDSRSVDQNIAQIRSKVKDKSIITTIPNYGYRSSQIKVLI